MTKSEELKKHLKKGQLYKRAELEKWSKSVDRHLSELISTSDLIKVGPGIYYVPKKNAFGIEPPSDHSLVQKFLNDDNFLITSYNLYNRLGLGTTQLYNNQVVYNHHRSEDIVLGNKKFSFRKKASFPTKLSEEFVFVDFVNNLKKLAEDQPDLLERLRQKAQNMNKPKLQQAADKYGTAQTRKILEVA